MRTLNRAAAEALAGLGEGAAHAVTDVTGFGLLGHSWEMAERSSARLRIDASALPLYDGALAAAEAGVRTGGDARNREHLQGKVISTADPALEALTFDPQTSGGLLAAVSPVHAEMLTASGFTTVGQVLPGPASVELSP
jgi:selenide,water dikinase